MSRVTADEVREIIDTDLAGTTLDVWISAANSIVTANAGCIGNDEDTLKMVELYLSAHVVGMLSPDIRGFVSEEGPDGFKTKYSNPVQMSEVIDATPYGTTANMLAGGCLTNVSKPVATVDFF